MMDYPPKAYVKGDPSSITGTSLDVNMGGVVVNGEVLRGCLDVNEDLRLATRHLGMIVGKVDVEEILGSIFNDFCIGK